MAAFSALLALSALAGASAQSPPPGMGMVRPASGMQPIGGFFQNEDNLYSGPYQMVKVSGSVRPVVPAALVNDFPAGRS